MTSGSGLTPPGQDPEPGVDDDEAENLALSKLAAADLARDLAFGSPLPPFERKGAPTPTGQRPAAAGSDPGDEGDPRGDDPEAEAEIEIEGATRAPAPSPSGPSREELERQVIEASRDEADDELAGLVALAALSKDRPATNRPARPKKPTRLPRPRSSPTGPVDRWWRYGFPAFLVVMLIAIPLLVRHGYNLVLQSNEGEVVSVTKAPTDPGWEAVVAATPTLLVAHTDEKGSLIGASVLVLTGESTSGLLVLPPATVLQAPGESANTVAQKAFESGRAAGLQEAVGAGLNAALGEVVVLDPKQTADMIAPVGTLTVNSPHAVTAGSLRWKQGEIKLQPADVSAYLSAPVQGADDLSRMERFTAVWNAWLSAVAASNDPAVVPGETKTGLGRFVRAMAKTRNEIQVLPVEPAAAGVGAKTFVYVPVKNRVGPLVVKMIPFPTGAPPGARPRVRLLDGTGKLDHGLSASQLLVFAGTEVTAIGNATRFDYQTTQIIYYEDGMKEFAGLLRQGLGLGDVVKSQQQGESVDLTIILGTDWAQKPIAQQTIPLVTSPPSVVGTTIREVGGDG